MSRQSLAAALRRARKRSALRRPVVARRHRTVGPDDTLLVSFPRSGSTWLRFMLAAAASTEAIEFDSVDEIVPLVGAAPSGRAAEWGTAGRLIKSHERFSRLYVPRSQRFIFLIRDGRAAAVSYYYYCLRNGWWVGEFPGFLDAFLDGRLDGYGSWHRHVEGWLGEAAEDRDHLLVRYEDLHADATAELRRCAEFLRTPLTEERLGRGLAAGSVDRMRDSEQRRSTLPSKVVDPSIPVVRSTKSSSWREEFSDEDLLKFERRAARALSLGGYETS